MHKKNKIPREWKLRLMSPMLKKGDPHRCENYRGITVIRTFSRLYSRVLRDLLENMQRLKQKNKVASMQDDPVWITYSV